MIILIDAKKHETKFSIDLFFVFFNYLFWRGCGLEKRERESQEASLLSTGLCPMALRSSP